MNGTFVQKYSLNQRHPSQEMVFSWQSDRFLIIAILFFLLKTSDVCYKNLIFLIMAF